MHSGHIHTCCKMDRNLVSFERSLSYKFTIALVTNKLVGRLFLGWLHIIVAVYKQRSTKSFLIEFWIGSSKLSDDEGMMLDVIQ